MNNLVLPLNCNVMDEDEMMYFEGGLNPNQLYVSTALLDKNYCTSIAINYTGITGLSQSRIAHEIYAHAFLYYANPAISTGLAVIVGGMASGLGGVPGALIGVAAATAAFTYIKDHSNPIDIGGDSDIRVAVFDAIWTIT